MSDKPITTSVTWDTIDVNYAGQRIDNYLMNKLKGLPKSRLYRLLRKGEIRVNKKRVKPDYRLEEGDILRIAPIKLEDKPAKAKPPQSLCDDLLSRILYEDQDLLIINKPSGLACHGGTGVEYGLIEALRQARPEDKFLDLAHRLDRGTSGCLIIGKNRTVLSQIHDLLRKGEVDKRYLALVHGQWPVHVSLVDVPLIKNQSQSGERMVMVDESGKPAKTRFHIAEKYRYHTLIGASLLTGRTHQIRVHAAHVGCPLVCDDKYGERRFDKKLPADWPKRLFLHATSINFISPASGKDILVNVPLEAELQGLLDRL
ncbi:MAG: 23S rRNA pseudouridine(955/2504/2580) synthase RluC [Legionellales bacterium]|nr:23S rRNA pseudouridine(955/2504/2580) synthase RluC [Legionellales bacterium]